MLGQTSGAQQRQATSLLYSGEQFDSSLQQYHLRARNYNQANGQFTTLDPYAGNIYDPQSLHKYAYCHTDPVNGIDPSGEYSEYSLSSITMAASVAAGIIAGIGQYDYSRNVLHANAWDSICDSLGSAAMAFLAVYYAPATFTALMAGSIPALVFVSWGATNLIFEIQGLYVQFRSDQYTPMQKVSIVNKFLSIVLTGVLAGAAVRYGGPPSVEVTIRSPQGTATVVSDEAGTLGGQANVAQVASIARITPGSLPAAVEASLLRTLAHIDAGTTPTGSLATKWGTSFKNWAGDLPGAKGADSPYLEYRVSPPAGTSGAGPLRVVVNTQTGEMYYTWTHYGDAGTPAFVQIR